MKKLNHRTKVVILTVVIFLLLAAIYACGILIPDDAITGSFLNAKQSPGFKHPFGTDALGRDLFLRTLKGLSVSITVGLAASVISAVVAVLVGIVAATGSKRIDAVINWVIDLVMGVPHTILIILISFSPHRHRVNALVLPCEAYTRRGPAASLPAVCCRFSQARQVQRLDTHASSAAASCPAVHRRTYIALPSCNFA